MTVTVEIITGISNANEHKTLTGENLLELLVAHYDKGFPQYAKIYDGVVSQKTDITPGNMVDKNGNVLITDNELEELNNFSGRAIVCEYPSLQITFQEIILFIFALAATIILRPKIPTLPLDQSPIANAQPGSSNQLSARTNRARPWGRIPDIYGTIRHTVDLIGTPLVRYVGTIAQETTLFCVGRGSYSITEIQEGNTRVPDIPDATVAIFDQNTNPNELPVRPYISIGSSYAPIQIVSLYNGITGQTLEPRNATNFRTNATATSFGTSMVLQVDGDISAFSVGDDAYIDIPYQQVTVSYNRGRDVADDTLRRVTLSSRFQGDFQIIAIDAANNTVTINADTTSFTGGPQTFRNGQTFQPYLISGRGQIVLTTSRTSNSRWVGPFNFFPHPNSGGNNEVLVNIVAPNGLYRTSGTTDTPITVEIEADIKRINPDGSLHTTIRQPSFAQHTIVGSAADKRRLGTTMKIIMGNIGPDGMRVRFRRVTNTFYSSNTRDTDTVTIDSAYIVGDIPADADFGDVTWGVATIPANPESVVIRNRQLNMLVERRLPVIRGFSDSFEPDAPVTYRTNRLINPTSKAIDAIRAMTLDPLIGRRTLDTLDIQRLGELNQEIVDYFGTNNQNMIEFSHVFDSGEVSYENMIQAVANSIYCTPYRRGGVLHLAFDKKNRPARLLMNHRNKEPRSEIRTTHFGTDDDRDSIQATWLDPATDTFETLIIPNEGNNQNPQRHDLIGVRNLQQATVHANRLYNRLIHQNVNVQFNGTEEAALLVNNDVILVADNTRPEVQDGDILSVNGLVLELSQPVKMEARVAYSIWLQLDDATTQSIPITAGVDDMHVVLAATPVLRRPLVTGPESFARTTYQIVKADDSRLSRFVMIERGANSGNGSYSIQAVNDSDEIYARDQDFRAT